METGKPGLVSAPVHFSSMAAHTQKRMDVQVPLTGLYIHTVPALPTQPLPQPPTSGCTRDSPALHHLAMPPLYSTETLPFLTLHIASGLQSHSGLSLAAAAVVAPRPKSAGKHVCPHCGRDCMKPSVLEKHLRCHTGERPYPCTTCGVSFKTQSNLYKHKRTQAHARLLSESEQSGVESLESISTSRDTFTSSVSMEEASLPTAELSDLTVTMAKVCSGTTQSHSTTKGTHEKLTRNDEKPKRETKTSPLPTSRHLPLQRQEATLFSKQWESSVSRVKSQSYESTDSGFSEIGDHYSSLGSILHDNSMDSLTESTKEHHLETSDTHSGSQDSKDNAREQEQKILEERISKLISQNSAVVEDKQLENVRPRKTVLSKQGSIDLPMPYTYKDSFHFDMRINKMQNVGLQRNKNPAYYNSVPTTQHSMTMEHTPLTRSNSLPFSVTLLPPEKSTLTPPYQSDYVTLVRRGSSGQINPTSFAMKPVNQQSSMHRPLVRQTAIDCNHATDGLFKNSSVEEACFTSLSCNGGDGDICGEPSNRKFRRKKTQKFAYNKWYMYGGGTFKKLYDDRGGDSGVVKGKKSTLEHEVIQGLQRRLSVGHKETGSTAKNFTSNTTMVCQPGCPSPSTTRPLPAPVPGVELNLKSVQFHSSCSSLRMPLRRNLSLSTLPLSSVVSQVPHSTDGTSRTEVGGLINEGKRSDSTSQLGGAHIPSDRKKQRTDDKVICPPEMETDPNTLTHPSPSVTTIGVPQQDTTFTYINVQTNQNYAQFKAALFPACIISTNAPSTTASPATSIPTAAKTSFLPKYQLKLPNAFSELESNPSLHIENERTGREGSSLISVKTLPLASVSEKQCGDPINTLLTLPHTSNLSSAQLDLPSGATANSYQARTPGLSPQVNLSMDVVTPKTTACLHNYQAGLCGTTTESPSMKTSVQLLKPATPEAENTTTSTKTAEHNEPHPVARAGFSQAQQHINASTLLDRVTTCSNTPLIPCNIVPFDSGQPVAQNVFHVHTADLQICLQLISDEQLALIQPQIERQTGSVFSQMTEMEGTKNKATNFDASPRANEGRDCEEPGLERETNQIKSAATLNIDNINPLMCFSSENAQPTLSLTQAAAEGPALSTRPHKQSHKNTEPCNYAAQVMPTEASLRGVKEGTSQTSQGEHALPVNCSTEDQRLLPDGRVSQVQPIPQKPSVSVQHKLDPKNTIAVSLSSQQDCNTELLVEESQLKPRNQGRSLCSLNKIKTVAHQSYGSNNEITPWFAQVGADPAFDWRSPSFISSFSISNGRSPRRVDTQASIDCVSPVECTLSESLTSSKHVNTGQEQVLDNPTPALETNLSKSQDLSSLAPAEHQAAQVTSGSGNIQVHVPKDLPAELPTIPNPSADGHPSTGCAAQQEQPPLGDGGAPWCPHTTAQEATPTHQPRMEGQGRNAVGGVGGLGAHVTSADTLQKAEEEVIKVKTDSFENSLLSEQHLQHISQTDLGMSAYPLQRSAPLPGTDKYLTQATNSTPLAPGNNSPPSVEAEQHFCTCGDDQHLFADDHQPSAGDHQPSADDHQPSADDQHPSADDHQPSADDQHPSAGDQHPSAGDQHPSAGDQHPSAGDQHPSAGDQHPSAGDQHPSAGDQHPSAGDQHPSADDQHPSADDQHPSADDQHPSADDQHPSADDQHPSADDQHPSADDQHPSADDQHPSADDQHPSAGNQQPTVAVSDTQPCFQHMFSYAALTKSDTDAWAEHGGHNGWGADWGADPGLLSDVKATSLPAQIKTFCAIDDVNAALLENRKNQENQSSIAPSHTFKYPQSTSDTMHRGGSRNAEKYQAEQFQSFQGAELQCFQGAELVRPVQGCQDYPEDTSSSDDEGKLIIEL